MVDAKLVTKQNVFSGKQDGKGRWRTWSFKSRACCAAHVTKLYYILRVSRDDEALDSDRIRPATNGMKMWRWMVTRWEPIVIFPLQRVRQTIRVMQWNVSGTDVTQLPTAWTDQVKDHEQQSSNKTSDWIRLEVVLYYHLHKMSLCQNTCSRTQERMTSAI